MGDDHFLLTSQNYLYSSLRDDDDADDDDEGREGGRSGRGQEMTRAYSLTSPYSLHNRI